MVMERPFTRSHQPGNLLHFISDIHVFATSWEFQASIITVCAKAAMVMELPSTQRYQPPYTSFPTLLCLQHHGVSGFDLFKFVSHHVMCYSDHLARF